jgi:hypothetical protein
MLSLHDLNCRTVQPLPDEVEGIQNYWVYLLSAARSSRQSRPHRDTFDSGINHIVAGGWGSPFEFTVSVG